MSNILPGGESLLQRGLLEALEVAGRRGVDREPLLGRPGYEGDRDQARRALAALLRDGLVAEWKGRLYALRYTDWVSGVIQRLEGGDALVRTGEGGEAGYFVPRRYLKGAGDGDTVLIKAARRQRRKAQHHLPEAVVDRVVSRANPTLVGTLEQDGRRRWLVPFDKRLRIDVEVAGGESISEDQYVEVETVAEPGPRGGPLQGRVVDLLGRVESPGVDVQVVLRHFKIPEPFSAAALEEAEGLPSDPDPGDWGARRDLRGESIVTIDGADARDFDDAISVLALPGGGWRLGVHIADVAHYVAEGSALDLEAYRRGTSVYFPERAVPMIPERLSNGLCSLKPDRPRLAVSVFLDFERSGRVARRDFCNSVIRSCRRFTYEEVHSLLEGDGGGAPEEGPPAMLREARRLMEVLRRKRTERGSLDFDLPEGSVILDQEGFTVGVRPDRRLISHRIIEEFMIAANEAVAFELQSHESPALYRVHEAPDPDRLEELRETLAPLGLTLKGDLERLHPQQMQSLIDRAEGRPEAPFVNNLVLRSMKQARYEPECRGHYALSSRHYTHFTSPIRRYPDLVVHRRLKSLIDPRGVDNAAATRLAERLPAIARRSSDTERRAEKAERELLNWKLVRLLADRVGESFLGRVTGVQRFGMFVQLTEYLVDGLVPIQSLTDDFYRYDGQAHTLTGLEEERVFRLADELEVELASVDLRRRELQLRVAGMPEGETGLGRREGGPRRSSRRR